MNGGWGGTRDVLDVCRLAIFCFRPGSLLTPLYPALHPPSGCAVAVSFTKVPSSSPTAFSYAHAGAFMGLITGPSARPSSANSSSSLLRAPGCAPALSGSCEQHPRLRSSCLGSLLSYSISRRAGMAAAKPLRMGWGSCHFSPHTVRSSHTTFCVFL